MKNKFNFKIVGSGPTGLLLSIALSKFDCNIFLTDLLTKDWLIDKDFYLTDAWLPEINLWVGEYPYLLRPAFEEICYIYLNR